MYALDKYVNAVVSALPYPICRVEKLDIVEEVNNANVNNVGSGLSEDGVSRDRSVTCDDDKLFVGESSGARGGGIPAGSGAFDKGVGGDGDEIGVDVPDKPDPLTEGQLNKITLALDTFGMEVVRTPYVHFVVLRPL